MHKYCCNCRTGSRQVVKTVDAPAIDGVADSAWSSAPKTMVAVQAIPAALMQSNKTHQKGEYAKTWAKDGSYIKGPEREDRLAMSFPISGEFSNNKRSHVDMIHDVWH